VRRAARRARPQSLSAAVRGVSQSLRINNNNLGNSTFTGAPQRESCETTSEPSSW
jgi:hypothetical protein